MRIPHSTYRLQITPGLPLAEAALQIDYLDQLGIDWLYLSPLLQAEHGSDHGYDVIDHSRTDTERGGWEGFAGLAATAHHAGRSIMVDIVPNHVGIATPLDSVWWADVLRYGKTSQYANAFDIDWDAGGGRIRIPVLGDGYNELRELRIDGDALCYYEHRYPIAPGSAGGTPREVHDRQHYELVHFRRADADLNYRRFFAVNTLAAVRVEDSKVFAVSHREIKRWIDAGFVDGLRVDHPDGVADPGDYLAQLDALTGQIYTVVEKILEPGEQLPSSWRCAGTTGYDALALIDRVLVDPAGCERLTELDSQLRGAACDFHELVHDRKRAVTDGILHSEVARLRRVLSAEINVASCDADSSTEVDSLTDAIAELVSSYPVYRTYPDSGTQVINQAAANAARRRPDLASHLAVVSAAAAATGSEFAVRLQQTSGAVMAKSVEDCAFYRYPRLASLTEVGADPTVFSVDPAAFHHAQQERARLWPDSMTTLSTHDTKRGEDVRARIHVLSEIPDEWASAVTRWITRLDFPDGVLANLLFQTAVGAWPISADRLHGYAEKAAREAGNSTTWIDPDHEFEARLHALVDACYQDEVIARELSTFADQIRAAGWSNSLAAKLLQLSSPGVPDVYRGSELWENCLVDPDNRRPFDPFTAGGAAALLAQLDDGLLPPVDASGAAKLLVVSRTLRMRRQHPRLFTGYSPISASGPSSDHLVALDRGGAIAFATRLPVGLDAKGGWRTTTVTLSDTGWANAITGEQVDGKCAADGQIVISLAALFDRYPVALLIPSDPSLR